MLRSQAITGSIALFDFQRSRDPDENLEIFFYIFASEAQSNEDDKTLLAQI